MDNRKLVVLFGSQTGNSQEVAERIWREAKCYHFHGPIRSMDEYPISQLVFEPLVIFVCSTTGQGDQPDNMKKFWRFLLRRNLPTNSLQNVKFGVLGLGDSSYVKFNHVAKKLQRRLEGLGGQSICSVGLADDQHDLGADAVVDPWIDNLWNVITRLYPLPPNVIAIDRSSLPPSRWDVRILDDNRINENNLNWEEVREESSNIATVLSNERITATEHFQAIPRRYVFQLLSQFPSSELEQEKLTEFASASGQEELYNYCNRPRRTILEVLSDFPEVVPNIPVSYFFEIFQPIRPRAFSIASSPKAHPGEIHILLAVVNYKTKLFIPRLGLCSNWLATMKTKDKLRVSIKKGSFTFPLSKDIPLIMVGPGTGVAPFRSLINEYIANCTGDKSTLLLVFGSRNQAGDFHCRKEWEKLKDKGFLTLLTAFSRDQAHKIYVQHIIEEESTIVWSFLKRNAFIYVAGNSNNMPTSVRDAFINVLKKEGHLSLEGALKHIEDMEASGRYQTETWA